MGYLILNKFKSLNLLFPLLNLKKDAKINVDNKLIKTYCWWDKTSENIEDYYLLVLFCVDKADKDFNLYNKRIITPHNALVNCYETDKGQLFIFNLIDHRKDIDCFIKGEYSQLSTSTKQKILTYWGELNKTEKCNLLDGEPVYPRHVILYPEYYFEEVAKELMYKDGGAYLKSVGELWSKPDTKLILDKATDTLISGNETLECNIINMCTIDYNQLTLKL